MPALIGPEGLTAIGLRVRAATGGRPYGDAFGAVAVGAGANPHHHLPCKTTTAAPRHGMAQCDIPPMAASKPKRGEAIISIAL